MTAGYNHLNLPREVTVQSINGIDPGGIIQWTYDATGRKLKKVSPDGITLYHNGIEKAGGGIFVYHAEGRAAFYPGNPSATPPVEARWDYEFAMRDHPEVNSGQALGNTRITFADLNYDGYLQANPGDWIADDPHGSPVGYTEVLQENHYYPFGMNMGGPWREPEVEAKVNRYQYNGKELNSDLGLGWNDYGARWYDAAVGRWNAVDPSSELYNPYSNYSYVLNRPTTAIDPDGNVVIFINGNHFGSGRKPEYWRAYQKTLIIDRQASQWLDHGEYHYVNREIAAFDEAVMSHLGDNNPLYYDGADGGFAPFHSYNHSASARRLSGFLNGRKDAKSIIESLARDENGNITETIKVITHSMGGAYGEGFVEALQEYIKENNLTGQVKITLLAHFDPFQGSEMSANDDIYTQQFMHKGGKGKNGSLGWMANERVPGVDFFSIDPKDSSHSITSFFGDISKLKEGTYKWDGKKWVNVQNKQ